MNIITEKATRNDLNTLLDFMKEYCKIERIEFHKERSRKAVIELLTHEDIGSIWIIKFKNVTIGYYCLAYNFSLDIGGRDCFLDEIYIDPSFRQKGIGTEVMKLIVKYLKSMKCKGIHLLVYDFNKPAFEFYCKNGFIKQDGMFMTRYI